MQSKIGSQFEFMLELQRIVIVPPYCGVPRLSHQLPVLVLVIDVVAVCVKTIVGVDSGVEVGVELTAVVVVDVLADIVVEVLAEVVLAVDEEQETNTNEITTR